MVPGPSDGEKASLAPIQHRGFSIFKDAEDSKHIRESFVAATRTKTSNLPVMQDEVSARTTTQDSIVTLQSAGSMDLDDLQQELVIYLRKRGAHVQLGEPPGTVNADTKVIVVVAQVPRMQESQELVKVFLEKQPKTPVVVLLLRPRPLKGYQADTNLFFDLGVHDVFMQPDCEEDIQDVVDVMFCRVQTHLHREEDIRNKAFARETELFWKSTHRVFPSIPKLCTTLEEPAVGGKVGRHHNIVKKINAGKTGQVFLVVDSRTQHLRALKALPKSKLESFEMVRDVEQEMSILSRLRHPNVVALLGEAHSPKHINILMEFVGHRNLFHLMRANEDGRLSKTTSCHIFSQIVSAVAYCHGEGVAHRDLKPENIGISDDGVTAKLVDFGFADVADAPLRHVGTMPFIAPEVLAQEQAAYDATAVDVWALGVILLEILCGVNTLPRILGWAQAGSAKRKSAEDICQYFSNPDSFPKALEVRLGKDCLRSAGFLELMQGMLRIDIASRWSSSTVQKSPWIGGASNGESTQ